MAFVNAWDCGTSAQSISATVSVSSGDTLLAYAVTDSNSASVFTWPSGFTQIAVLQNTADGMRFAVAIKESCSGSEGLLSISTDLQPIEGGFSAFSGRDTASINAFSVDTVQADSLASSPRTVDSNSVTPSADGTDVVIVVGTDIATPGTATVTLAGSTVSGTTGAWTTAHNIGTGTYRRVGLAYATQTTAGAITVRGTSTLSAGTAGMAIVTIGLKASGGGGGTTYPMYAYAQQ